MRPTANEDQDRVSEPAEPAELSGSIDPGVRRFPSEEDEPGRDRAVPAGWVVPIALLVVILLAWAVLLGS